MALEKPGEPPEVMALVQGYVIEVRCSICGSMRTWVEGEEAIRELIQRARGANYY